MIFLPNKNERYLAVLRNYVQLNYLKNKNIKKCRNFIRLIDIAEALIENDLQPIFIEDFASDLLSCIYIEKNANFNFSIGSLGTFLIPKKAFTCLLLSICKNSDNISILSLDNKILIKSKTKFEKEYIPLIKKLFGIYFYEIKGGNLNIILNFAKTAKKSEYKKTDREKLLGPLSLTDCYLN